MSWQPKGRYFSFDEAAIQSFAPACSGVYGLYNFNYQIFIGEADNMREALLRHLRESDFGAQRFWPTGFTFETYPAVTRVGHAQQLIERYRPVLQFHARLVGVTPLVAPMRAVELEEFPAQDEPTRKSRLSLAGLAESHVARVAAFAASSTAIFFLGIVTGQSIQKKVDAKTLAALARLTMARAESTVQRYPDVAAISVALAQEARDDSPTNLPDVEEITTPVELENTHSRAERKAVPAIHSTAPIEAQKSWSVQVAAAPTQELADGVVRRLHGAGFDSRVIQAQVNGKTFFRVRVGHFTARAEADAQRVALGQQESYRDAFVAAD